MRRMEGVWEGESWSEFWAAVQSALQRRDQLPLQRRLLSAQSRVCSASSLSGVQWASFPPGSRGPATLGRGVFVSVQTHRPGSWWMVVRPQMAPK